MLLFDLIYDDIFASSLSEFVVEDGGWYLHEEEHVEEYKNDEVDVIGLVILDGEVLVVGVVVVGR